jgi:hypothetical protein
MTAVKAEAICYLWFRAGSGGRGLPRHWIMLADSQAIEKALGEKE